MLDSQRTYNYSIYMDWFYYIMGKLFIWALFILIIGGIGYYLGYNHAKLPVLKDFAIVRTEELKRPVPSANVSVIPKKEIITETPEATKSASPSAATKSPTPKK